MEGFLRWQHRIFIMDRTRSLRSLVWRFTPGRSISEIVFLMGTVAYNYFKIIYEVELNEVPCITHRSFQTQTATFHITAFPRLILPMK